MRYLLGIILFLIVSCPNAIPAEKIDSFLLAASIAYDLPSPNLSTIMSKIDTQGNGTPVVVFNRLMWDRSEPVIVKSPFDNNNTKAITATDGTAIYPAQIVGDEVVFTARKVPALGYKVFWLNKADKEVKSQVKGSDDSIENEFFRITVDPDSGAISQIYDKKNKLDLVPAREQSAVSKIFGPAKGSVMIETGPARATVRSDYDYGDSSVVQDIMLYDGMPMIFFTATVDWNESAALDLAFPVALSNPKAAFEKPISGDPSWADLTSGGRGFSLLTDGNFSPKTTGSTLQLPLSAESSIYETIYALYPHKGSWHNAGTSQKSTELQSPLYAVSTATHAGSLPKQDSLMSLSPTNLSVLFLRRSQDGKDLILTFRETDGVKTKAVLQTKLPIKTYVQTDKLGQNLGDPKPFDKKIKITIGKHEIKTLRLGL